MAMLAGKLIFVTGAGSGIGKTACEILIREGAVVIAGDISREKAEQTVNGYKPSIDHHIGLHVDVTDSKSIKNAFESMVEAYKRPPSILVNCAGITRDSFLLELSEQDFDDVINTNLKGTFLLMKAFANTLSKYELSQGSIINIGSISGKVSNIGQSNYNASKVGVVSLTKTAAKEFSKLNIRCNVVIPGFIKTPMTATVPENVKNHIIKRTSMNRMGRPEEIGEVIAFLASDKSSFINGASIEVSGGFC